MKFSGGSILLVILAVALILAIVITLTLGGNRSRHGYGFALPEFPAQSTTITSPILSSQLS